MKRDSLHLRVLRVKVTGGDNLEGYRPVTDAEALRTLLFDVCDNCHGDPHKIDRWTCHVCRGSGWTPKDGVNRSVWPKFLQPSGVEQVPSIVFPASMLDPEGDA